VAQNSVKIGFISTFSGPTAVIGNDMRNSFELALDHLGRKMGGLPVEVICAFRKNGTAVSLTDGQQFH
jgi:branched-chain amino acid transport system substrate-binding protein